MDKLDRLVTEPAFPAGKAGQILSSLTVRRAEKAEVVNGRMTTLRRDVTDADEKLKRLYWLVEEGLIDADDILQNRLAAPEWAKEGVNPNIEIDPALIERFGRMMRENFGTGSVPFRKGYLQVLIRVIEVDGDRVRIKESKDVLEKLSWRPGRAKSSVRR